MSGVDHSSATAPGSVCNPRAFTLLLVASSVASGIVQFQVTSVNIALHRIGGHWSRAATAVLNASRQIGSALGVATFGALIVGPTGDALVAGLQLSAALSAAAAGGGHWKRDRDVVARA